jgi:AcrR family transcriptional regulator
LAKAKQAARPKARQTAAGSASDSTRDAILEAAARIFHQRGYKATTLRDLANVCNLKAGSIYYYFSSKEEIVGEILDRGMHSLIDNVKAAAEQAEPRNSYRAKIDAALRAHLRTLLTNPYAAANLRMFSQAPPAMRRRNQKLHDVYHAFWRTLFTRAQAAKEIRGDVNLSLLRLLIIGAVNLVDQWFKPEQGPLAPDDLIRQFMLVLFEGMTPAAKITKR